ncbi:hypothetical protein HMPREF3291_12080 [Bacillus sp. HMSC76G11]|nr:hypothetical protein HMPREF3291_12080 [Bacillus sp. HMSC76G11]
MELDTRKSGTVCLERIFASRNKVSAKMQLAIGILNGGQLYPKTILLSRTGQLLAELNLLLAGMD